jgi:xanthosine utilization system XapX-like protein
VVRPRHRSRGPWWFIVLGVAIALCVPGSGKAAFLIRTVAMGAVPIASPTVIAAVRRARLRRGRRDHPEAPWTWDHDWDPAGESHSAAADGWWHLGAGLVVLGVTMLASYAVFSVHGARPGKVVVIGLVAPVLVGAWYLRAGWRELRRGALQIAWPRFPCFTGERFDATFWGSDGGATFQGAKVELRCVKELRGDRSRAWCVWSDVYTVPADYLPGRGDGLPLGFEVPPEGLGTRLDGPDVTYWEIRVVGTTDSGPVYERFLVPIYEKPAAAQAAT